MDDGAPVTYLLTSPVQEVTWESAVVDSPQVSVSICEVSALVNPFEAQCSLAVDGKFCCT